MRFFLSKIDKYRFETSKGLPDVIDIRFPSELSQEKAVKSDFLVFVVDDDPHFMQAINTHFSNLTFEKEGILYQFVVKNYATGDSCLKDLKLDPSIIFLNYDINKGVKNSMGGPEIIEQIQKLRPHQKVVVVKTSEDDIKGVIVDRDLRKLISNDAEAIKRITHLLKDLLD